MCTYGISCDELVEPFELFLRDQEGDVSAEVVASAWNRLARRYRWADKLVVALACASTNKRKPKRKPRASAVR